ncbi:chemotaxis protein MotB [Oxalicibacterium flavum]|uniref:Chemotaxis protein MotB n=1 Tax=Oxalicibacterium flavum TaxID=179467 RepID=A0A8J2XXU4_9BURK|nr:flagellar motor protein MotB [Oxalicibacterium flavum]GGC04086.1 chemotaxis protein MotB [Oxalicibacterium flavum]
MADEGLRPIIIKRIKKSSGHHGGAWKIAYADFVTAMMAFFLLMWLLGSTSKGDLEGIADYFATPLKVAMAGGTGSGDASSVIQGGGKDLTRIEGQQQQGEDPKTRKRFDLKEAEAELARAEARRLRALKERIETAIANIPSLQQYKNQLLIDITTEGLRIQIVDEQNRPMFALSRAELQPYTKVILHEIAKTLNDIPNKVSLSGHTDATPYASGERSYSNWELSSDRANASRRELIAGGLQEDKILRVVGLSSAVLFDTGNPYNPINRRISIIVMNKKTEESITRENQTVDVQNEEAVQQAVGQDAATPGEADVSPPR